MWTSLQEHILIIHIPYNPTMKHAHFIISIDQEEKLDEKEK